MQLADPKVAVEAFLAIALEDSYEIGTAGDATMTDTGQVPEDPLKVKEAAVYALGDALAKEGDVNAISKMFADIRPVFKTIPKARTAKILKYLIDGLATVPNSAPIQEQICLETIQWCKEDKRTFLRHRIETRLALLYHQMRSYSRGLEVIATLLHDVKRLDDKLLLVEIHCIETMLYFSTKNIPKAKAALTAARSNANAIHCPPLLQAELDVLLLRECRQAGGIHLDEHDPQTAHSYFFEAFEAYNVADDARARIALKCMFLSKIMSNQAEDVHVLSKQKQYVRYEGRDTEAFRNIANSYKKRDLKMFEQALRDYEAEICHDPIIQRHTNELYQSLLEQNILKVLEPFARVEVEHVGHLMELPHETIQSKLCEMILDKKLAGTLDQGAGILILFADTQIPSIYKDCLEVFNNLSTVVNILHQKAHEAL